MKIRVTFKTPDAVDDAINETIDDESEARAALTVIEKFTRFGEYVTIEFDTEAGTAQVVPV